MTGGHRSRLDLGGAITALVTPFRDDGSVDEAALRRLVEWQVASGIDGLSPCGTTGEGATLSPEEHERVVGVVVEAAGRRVPVVAGCGSNDTRRTIHLARAVSRAGADALLVVTPYYNKPNRSGMIVHFRAVTEEVGLPVVVYNVPGRTGQNLGTELALRLAELPGIVGIKDASGNLEQVAELVAGRPEGFAVLSGDDALALPAMALGADGVISVVSNEAPAETSALAARAAEGNFAAARELHYRLLPLMKANFLETNPVPVKCALEWLGRSSGRVRPPLGPPEPATVEAVRKALVRAGLLGEAR